MIIAIGIISPMPTIATTTMRFNSANFIVRSLVIRAAECTSASRRRVLQGRGMV
jgi:hypothetical protein